MRLLLTVVILMTANAALALGEGRFVMTAFETFNGLNGFLVLDTKTGKVRQCSAFYPEKRDDGELKSGIRCYDWSDITEPGHILSK